MTGLALPGNLKPRPAEIGAIRIGRKAGEESVSSSNKKFRAPQKLDHFLVTKPITDRDRDPEIDHPVMEALAPYADPDGKLRAIPILFPVDELELLLSSEYAYYSGMRRACHGDGKTATEVDSAGKRTQRACPCEKIEPNSKEKCKVSTHFRCTIIAGDKSKAGGVHVLRTHSVISTTQLAGSILDIRNRVGTIANVPLWLKIKPVLASPNGKPTTVYVVHLELRAEDISHARQAALSEAATRQQVRKAVEGVIDAEVVAQYKAIAASPESATTAARVQSEFYPENKRPNTKTAEQAFAKFGERGIEAAKLLRYLRKSSIDEITDVDIGRLRDLYTFTDDELLEELEQ